MGKINAGILGGVGGKIGTVSGYRRYGKNILRTQSTKNILANTTRFETQNLYSANLARNLEHYTPGIVACLAQDGIEYNEDWEKILKNNKPELVGSKPSYIVKAQLPFSVNEYQSTTFSVYQASQNRIAASSANLLKLKITGWLTHRRLMFWRSNTGFATNNYAVISANIATQANRLADVTNNNYNVFMLLFTNPLFPERYQATFNVISKTAY